MTAPTLEPQTFVYRFPCPPWCGPDCDKTHEEERDGSLTEVSAHRSPAVLIAGPDSFSGVTARLARFDLNDDIDDPLIEIATLDPYLSVSGARRFAALLLNLADDAEADSAGRKAA